jgi:hypothetical protein
LNEVTHLIANNQRLPIRRPHERKRVPQPPHLVDAGLVPHVPELDHAVAAHAAQLGLLGGVEGDLFDGCRVALELGGEFDVRLLWVPWSKRGGKASSASVVKRTCVYIYV